MQKFEFSYDKENDDLFLFKPNSKSKGSVEIGEFILDFNARKEVVGMQFLNATDLMKDIFDESSSSLKQLLCSLEGCKIDIKTKGDMLVIRILLIGKTREITAPLCLPAIREPSPALAFA